MINNDRWSALSMKDRAALIDIYVKSGIIDLGEIRKDYNSFGPGGDLLKAGASFIPVVGTVIDGIDLIKDPSWENAAYFAGSLASDVLGLTAIKGLAKTSKALKATKALAETEKAAAAAKYAKLASKTEAIDKLNNAKKSARAAGQRGRAYYDDLVAKRKLQEAKVAAGKAEAQFKLASGVNLFYDTTSQGIQTLEPYVQHYNGGKLNKFATGGPIEPIYYDDTYIEPAVVKAFKSQEEYNRYQGKKGAKAVRRGMNKAANTIAEGLRYTPVVGDVMDGLEAYEEAKTGNLTKAGVLAGLTLLPNALEKPVKAVGKGLKNLRLYNRYVKDVKRFEEPVQFAIKGMEENYDVLKSNFPEMNTVEDARRTMNTTVSTRFKPLEAIKNKTLGDYTFDNGEIWLNAYAPIRLKQAWKSPKHSIKQLKQVAAHEGTHSALDNLNITLSEKNGNYYRVIPGSAIENSTKHLYNKAGREGTAWQNLPEEFIAEMNAARYTLGEKPGSSIDSWSTPHANRSENYLSRRFSFEPGEAGELVGIYEGFGFDNGGRLNKFVTGGPTEQNIDSNWLKSFKELPDGYKKAVLKLVTDLNYDVKDAESLYNSGKLKAIIEAKYQNTPSGRVRQNDSPTSTESSNLEKKINKMLYNSTDRVLPNMKYAIPYIEELEVKVPGVGRTTTNALDSLAKYAVQAQIPLSEALGLSAQETAFGALPQYNYVEIVGTEEEKQKARDFNRALGNSSYFRNYGIIPAENFVRDFRYNIVEDPIDRDVPPLLHAFNYWKKGNYNRGDSDHTKDVKAKGEAVMKTKVIQDWINNSKFAQKALNLSK